MNFEQAPSYKKIKRKTAKKYDYSGHVKGGWRFINIDRYVDNEDCVFSITHKDLHQRVRMNDLAMLSMYYLLEDYLTHLKYLPNQKENDHE